MTNKILEMHYTTIQKMLENEVISRFLSSLEEKFTETAVIGHKITCSIDIPVKQITALFDGDIKIIACITNHSVRSESLTKMPDLMKIYESVKKEVQKEYSAKPEALNVLEPIIHIHSCTVEISPDSGMDRKYEYAAFIWLLGECIEVLHSCYGRII